MKPRDAHTTIPVFKLYGDGADWPTPDLLHCESIAARSRLHDWEIGAHRHADLTQLLYIRRGWAEVEIEGEHTRIEQAAIQVVPPLCVHGFRFSERVEGYVLTLASPLLRQLETELDGQQDALHSAALHLAGADRRYLNTLFDAIDREYRNAAPARELLLQSLVGVLAVWVARQMLVGGEQRPSRGQELLARFTRLVEQDFRQQRSVEAYAMQLDISPAYLNTLARRFAGHTALEVVAPAIVAGGQAGADLHGHDHQPDLGSTWIFRACVLFPILQANDRAIAKGIPSAAQRRLSISCRRAPARRCHQARRATPLR